ncbi:hypothetical protein G7046_g6648 [Stylonectria norvegica]|nr:hypothetical protein G7046_g6648 [Stylonectria norvegica]
MAMASFQTHSSGNLHGHGHAKITKPRSRQAVKPILKRLQSPSEKNSADLNRGWDEQAQFAYASHPHAAPTRRDDDSPAASATPVNESSALPFSTAATATAAAIASATSTPIHAPRSARDVSFSLSANDLTNGGAAGGARSNKYSHARSASGTSHASVATSNSGRNGSFVHPFQQTPRTSTPPLSYANSLVSLENPAAPRDYSPTITEDDDDIESRNYQTSRTYPLPPRHRRPSLASQRTSSLSDINQPLRVTTTSRANSGPAARIAHSIVTRSRSDLHLTTASSIALDSASSISPPTGSFVSPQMLSAASTSSTAMSPLRSSLDMNGFRIRSRSDIDTATRQEQVREARRKFEEKEKVKEEKYAREQIRKQERADTKEAQQRVGGGKPHTHDRGGSFGHSRISCDRTSSSTDVRPTISRKNTAPMLGESSAEKLSFASRGYDSVSTGQNPRPRTDGVHFEPTRRNTTTKRKTTGAWTAFVLWFRTRLLKLGKR